MRPLFTSLAIVLFVLPALEGCRGRGDVTVRDTEGRAFRVRCAAQATTCSVEPAAPAKPADRAKPTDPAKPADPAKPTDPAKSVALGAASRPVLRATGRLVGVCDARGEAENVHPADCRVLVCSDDADCPPMPALEGGACVGGKCVNPANAIIAQDAVMLCLAGTGPGHDAPRQVERYALAMNCGDPCVIPAPCNP